MIDPQDAGVAKMMAQAGNEVPITLPANVFRVLWSKSPVLPGCKEPVGGSATGDPERERPRFPPHVEPAGVNPERQVEIEPRPLGSGLAGERRQLLFRNPLAVEMVVSRARIEGVLRKALVAK